MAGIITAIVGFSSSFAVVIAGLRAVGATADQAASGLLILCLTVGVGCIAFGLMYRRPITLAWSTPGAALLATAVAPGGFGVAVGAFVVSGLLLAVTGLVPAVAAAVRSIPQAVASAMLAGVLLVLCTAPFRALPESPWAIGSVLLTWAVLVRVAPRWAVPGALVASGVAMAASGALTGLSVASMAPRVEWVSPQWSLQAVIALAVPLYLVTMTSQNIPGAAVMAGFGYEVPFRPVVAFTGAASAAGAVLGGHAINLSAISAALAAGPEAGRDPSRRWLAAVSTGVTYLVLGVTAQAVVTVAEAAPPGLFAAVAGVALLSSLALATAQALERAEARLAAAVTLVVAASGIQIGGIGSAFWALVAGYVLYVLTVPRHLR